MLRTLVVMILTTLSSILLAGDTSHRPKIGLALGGGGARGAAEVGVLKVLEEKGIRPDYIAGTSIGAIVGGLYACGYSAQELDSLFRCQEWLSLIGDRNKDLRKSILDQRDGVTYLFGFPISGSTKKTETEEFGLGLLGGTNITLLLDSLTKQYDGIASFDDLPIPFRCVAVDLKKHEEVIMDSCELELAMRASIGIPGAFKPVKWKGKLLVDGGMLNNLPVDVARSMGADYVIAIDLMDAKRATQQSRGEMHTRGLASILEWKYVRPDLDKYQVNRRDADVLIHPDVEGYHGASFSEDDTRQLIARGEEAGRAALDKLAEVKKLVVPKEVKRGSKGSKGSKGLSGSKGSRSSKGSRESERRALKFGDK